MEQILKVDQRDIDDEAELIELAEYCFAQAKDASESAGPKWMAEGLKAKRLARGIRDRINEIQHDNQRMQFMREMKAH